MFSVNSETRNYSQQTLEFRRFIHNPACGKTRNIYEHWTETGEKIETGRQGKIIKNKGLLAHRKKPQSRSEIKLIEVKKSTAVYSLSSFPVSRAVQAPLQLTGLVACGRVTADPWSYSVCRQEETEAESSPERAHG